MALGRHVSNIGSQILRGMMLINLSNHPSPTWSDAQKQAAERDFGEVRDLDFPHIDPGIDTGSVIELARQYLEQTLTLLEQPHPIHAVHVMGEMTFTHAFVNLAQACGVRCVASTSRRDVIELGDGEKRVRFTFERFRDYSSPCDMWGYLGCDGQLRR
jgi:hypothetical protein